VVGALESLLKVTNAAKIPVISNDPEHVSRTGIAVISNNTDDVARGIVAAIGFSQYAVGKVAGEKLLKVLNGTPIANISVSPPSNHELHINVKQAKQLGISLDKQLLGRAHTIIGG
jgi:putative ABC transport system substrate-binding protein